MADLNKLVREVIINYRSTGLDEFLVKQAQAGAQADAAVVKTEKEVKARQSVERQLAANAARYSAETRAINELEKANKLLERAQAQNLQGTKDYAVLLADVTAKFDKQRVAMGLVVDQTAKLKAGFAALGEMGSKTMERLDISRKMSSASAITTDANKIAEVRAKYDDAFAAEETLRKGMAQLRKEMELTGGSAELLAMGEKKLQDAYDKTMKSLKGLTDEEKHAIASKQELVAAQQRAAEAAAKQAAEQQKLAAGFGRMGAQGATTMQGLGVSRGMSSASDPSLDPAAVERARAKYDEVTRATLKYRDALAELTRDAQKFNLGQEFVAQKSAEITQSYDSQIAKLTQVDVVQEEVSASAKKLAAQWAEMSRQGMQTPGQQAAERASNRLGQLSSTGGVSSAAAGYNAERAALVPLVAIEEQRDKQLQRISKALANRDINEKEATAAANQARATYANQRAELDKLHAANERAAKGAGLSAHAWQNLGYQINDVGTSLASGISPMQTFAQQAGQILQILQSGQGGIKGALKGIADGLVNLLARTGVFGLIAAGALTAGAAILSFQSTMKEVGNALLGAGQSAGVTAGQIQDIAEKSAKTANISVAAARDIELAFVKSGSVMGDALEPAVVAAENYARATGGKAVDATEVLSKALGSLGENGYGDLAKIARNFDDELEKEMKRMRAAGDEAGAQRLVIERFGEAFKKAQENMTAAGTTWNSITTGISDKWDQLTQRFGGGTKNIVQQLQEVDRSINVRKSVGASGDTASDTANQEKINELVQKRADLQAKVSAEAKKAKVDAEAATQAATQYNRATVESVVVDLSSVAKARQQLVDLSRSMNLAKEGNASKETIAGIKQAQDVLKQYLADADKAGGALNMQEQKAKEILTARLTASRAVTPEEKASAAAIQASADAYGTKTSATERQRQADDAYKATLQQSKDQTIQANKVLDQSTVTANKVAEANTNASQSVQKAIAQQKAQAEATSGQISESDKAERAIKLYNEQIAELGKASAENTRGKKQETEVQAGLNAQVKAGQINTTQAQQMLGGEIEKRRLAIEIAGAEGEARQTLQKRYEELDAAQKAQIATQNTAQALQVIEGQNQQISLLQKDIELVTADTMTRERQMAVRRAEIEVQKLGIATSSDEGQAIIKNAEKMAILNVEHRRLEDQQAKVREGQKAMADSFGSFLEDMISGTGKLTDAFATLGKSFVTSGLQSVLTGSGPLAGIMGTASNDPKEQGGLLGGLLPGMMKDAVKDGAKEGSAKGIMGGFGDLFGMDKGTMGKAVQGIGGAMAIGAGYGIGKQAGSMGQAAAGGALSGAVGGFMLGNMIMPGIGGAIGAGLGAAASGLLGLLGFDSQQKQKIKEQKQKWMDEYKDALPQINQFRSQLRGEAQTGNATTIKQAYDQMVQAWEKAVHGGDNAAGISIEREFGQFQQRLFLNFTRGFEGTFAEMTKGLGTNGPFQQAQQAVTQLGDGLKAFVADAVYFKVGQESIERAQHAAMDSALALLEPAKQLSQVEERLGQIGGAAAGLQTVLEQLGAGAEDAARMIQDHVVVAMANLRKSFDEGVQGKLFDAQDKGYLNDAKDLIKEVYGMLSDASLIGGNTDQVQTYFTTAAQKLVNESELTGAAFNELVAMFPELNGRVHEFIAAVQDTADAAKAAAEELEKRRQGYLDRTFAATTPSDTLAGQLMAQDRKANQDRIEEAKAGNGAIVQLEQALAAERGKVLFDFNKNALAQVVSAMQAGMDAANKTVDDARSKLEQAYQREATVLNTTISRLETFTKNIRTFKDSLLLNTAVSPLTPEQRYLEAQRQFRATSALAATGNTDAQDQLQATSQAYLDAARDYYASSESYYASFREVQGVLQRTETQAGYQLTLAQQQLAYLDNSVQGLITLNNSTLSVRDAVYQLNTAIAAQTAATAAAAAAQSGSGGAGFVGSAYQTLLGRAPDAAGAAYWSGQAPSSVVSGITGSTEYMVNQAYQSLLGRNPEAGAASYYAGKSAAEIQALIAGSAEYRTLHGMVAGGIVGNGAWNQDSVLASYAGGGAIALAGGEHVMPAPQTAMYRDELESMRRGAPRPANDDGIKAELQALRAEVRRLTAVTGQGHLETVGAVKEGNAMQAENTTVLKRVTVR